MLLIFGMNKSKRNINSLDITYVILQSEIEANIIQKVVYHDDTNVAPVPFYTLNIAFYISAVSQKRKSPL